MVCDSGKIEECDKIDDIVKIGKIKEIEKSIKLTNVMKSTEFHKIKIEVILMLDRTFLLFQIVEFSLQLGKMVANLG